MKIPPWSKVPPRVRSVVHLSVVTVTGAFATALFRGQWPNTLDEIKHDLVGASTAAIMAELILIRSLALQALSIDDRKSSTNPSEKDLS